MPPQKSLIAELLKKQIRMEEAECESSVDRSAQESSYCDASVNHELLQDDVRFSQLFNNTFSVTTNQFFPDSAQNTQKNTDQYVQNNTSISIHNFHELSNSGSAELPTGDSRDSLNSHDAFEIFAWNQKKKWESNGRTSPLKTTSEYCYYSNNNEPY